MYSITGSRNYFCLNSPQVCMGEMSGEFLLLFSSTFGSIPGSPGHSPPFTGNLENWFWGIPWGAHWFAQLLTHILY